MAAGGSGTPSPTRTSRRESSSSLSQLPFQPPPTRDSFKDILIFEERLKQNNQRLQKQRRKYEAFLGTLILIILYLCYTVFIIPSIYSLVHYGHVAMLLVSLVTLILFFVTGMYSEKIAYANKFVPQANRALRPFNVYLNTRTRSRFPLLSYFLRSTPPPPPTPTLPSSTPLSRRSSSSSHSSSSARSLGRRSPPGSPSAVSRSPSISPPGTQPRGVPLAPIPPAQNPRGELIFSNRVSGGFREGYERYRGEWERRRVGKSSGGGGWKGWWRGREESGSEKERERESSAEVENAQRRGRSVSLGTGSRQGSRGGGRVVSNPIPMNSGTVTTTEAVPFVPEVRVRAESFSALLGTMDEDEGRGREVGDG